MLYACIGVQPTSHVPRHHALWRGCRSSTTPKTFQPGLGLFERASQSRGAWIPLQPVRQGEHILFCPYCAPDAKSHAIMQRQLNELVVLLGDWLLLQQEPGDEETIQEFVTSKFGVTFPVSSYGNASAMILRVIGAVARHRSVSSWCITRTLADDVKNCCQWSGAGPVVQVPSGSTDRLFGLHPR